MRIECRDLAYAYTPAQEILQSVSLTWGTGQIVFILGSNGSGKTTLLECLSGLRPPLRGHVALDGHDLSALPPRTRAQMIGLVPQLHEPIFEFTVEQAVLMGRAPHLGLFERPGSNDRAAVREAIDAVGIHHLRHRPYTQISGGERQLALIARGLAQGAGCLLMDEPVAHLDPHHQHDVMASVRALTERGLSFAVTSHLPNHALLYADWTAFLIEGSVQIQGPPRSTITEASLQATYRMAFEIIEGASGSRAILPRQ